MGGWHLACACALLPWVVSGEYESADEAIADGVRLLMSGQQLRADIQKGRDELDTGLGVDGEEAFAELRSTE